MEQVDLESRISDAEASHMSLRKLMFEELRSVRDELKHVREMMASINSTVDIMLKTLEAEEKRDEAEQNGNGHG